MLGGVAVSEGSRYYAIHEPAERLVRIVANPAMPGHGTPAVVVDIYRTPDHGDVDTLLKANGWHRVSAWTNADDVPAAARQCMVESLRA